MEHNILRKHTSFDEFNVGQWKKNSQIFFKLSSTPGDLMNTSKQFSWQLYVHICSVNGSMKSHNVAFN